jgi:hypothetical protein
MGRREWGKVAGRKRSSNWRRKNNSKLKAARVWGGVRLQLRRSVGEKEKVRKRKIRKRKSQKKKEKDKKQEKVKKRKLKKDKQKHKQRKLKKSHIKRHKKKDKKKKHIKRYKNKNKKNQHKNKSSGRRPQVSPDPPLPHLVFLLIHLYYAI